MFEQLGHLLGCMSYHDDLPSARTLASGGSEKRAGKRSEALRSAGVCLNSLDTFLGACPITMTFFHCFCISISQVSWLSHNPVLFNFCFPYISMDMIVPYTAWHTISPMAIPCTEVIQGLYDLLVVTSEYFKKEDSLVLSYTKI